MQDELSPKPDNGIRTMKQENPPERFAGVH